MKSSQPHCHRSTVALGLSELVVLSRLRCSTHLLDQKKLCTKTILSYAGWKKMRRASKAYSLYRLASKIRGNAAICIPKSRTLITCFMELKGQSETPSSNTGLHYTWLCTQLCSLDFHSVWSWWLVISAISPPKIIHPSTGNTWKPYITILISFLLLHQ